MIQLSNMGSMSEDKQKTLLEYIKSFEPLICKIPDFDRIETFSCCTEQYEFPKVSVILPVYNVEKYLFHSMSCILNQTCREIEVICVDDCSTDSSLQILEFFALLDSRVKVIHHEKNLFAGIARNTGMAQAKGKYLYFFDPDDWCEHNLVEESVKNAETFESDIVILRGDAIDAETKKQSYIWGMDPKTPEPFSKENYSGNIFSFVPIAPWQKMFRHDFIAEKHLVFQGIRHANDHYFSYTTAASAKSISYIKDAILYHYRENTKGSLQRTKSQAPFCVLETFIATEKYLKNLHVEKKLIEDFREHFASHTLPYELLHTPPSGDGFKLFYAELRNHFFKDFALDQLQHFNDQEQEKIMQAIQKNAHECDFLLDMIQYYRPFQWEKARLQGEVQGLQGEIQCLKGESQLLQNSFSFRLGRMMTWPLRKVRNLIRKQK